MSEQIARELGEISATLKSIQKTQNDQTVSLKSMDARMRNVETKGAVTGAVTGGVMAIAIALIKDTFKT
ncbi:hypothetical protein [Planktotalea sp.]|uniref:hypothetical protein n=1 Tax=Planktotalea sp. TaxID=2029877 RepID=UPI003D6C084F